MLRYHSLPDATPLPRWELPPSRRLASGGVLSGALHTLGYYSTDVCLGSPPRRYDLIIDTGSSVTAVPCASCRACGTHHCGTEGRFDVSRSSTARRVGCRTAGPLLCESCAADVCGYSVHYTEGSAIKGHVVQDVAHLTRAGRAPEDDLAVQLPVYFGCQTSESGMFYKQEADGILGLQPPRTRSRVPSMLSSLAATSRSLVEAFSLCLSDTAGLFLMGGSAQRRRASTITVPMEHGAKARYSLKLSGIRVSNLAPGNNSFRALSFPQSVYSPTIVDSGTTFVYASSPLFRALNAHIKAQVPELERVGNKLCAMMTEQRLHAMPALEMVFAAHSTPLRISPRQYMVEFPRRNVLRGWSEPAQRNMCVGIFDNHAGGTVIGASIMRHREVVFDVRGSTISFTDMDCSRTSPRSASLERPFSFSSCESANTTASGFSPLGSVKALLKG
ncbi:hypothetical protein AB1Y20_003927 [Prymnesium parvum]|uniref:Peptidase A1 domain-containing protein n=1 Tax=Prymnesium parvum TaxID=97485 RepID=A0AB34J6B3_PRYPA